MNCVHIYFIFIFRATAIQLEGEKQWKIVAPHLPANDSLLYSFVASSEAIASGSMISPLHTILGGKKIIIYIYFLNWTKKNFYHHNLLFQVYH